MVLLAHLAIQVQLVTRALTAPVVQAARAVQLETLVTLEHQVTLEITG